MKRLVKTYQAAASFSLLFFGYQLGYHMSALAWKIVWIVLCFMVAFLIALLLWLWRIARQAAEDYELTGN